jgi:hypothetical protein
MRAERETPSAISYICHGLRPCNRAPWGCILDTCLLGSDALGDALHHVCRAGQILERLSNGVSILQTQLSNGARHEARRVGPYALPLCQRMKGGRGARKQGMAIRPHSVHDLRAMADHGQPRQHRCNAYAIMPLAPLTACEVGRIPHCDMERGITQENHTVFTLLHEALKGIVCDSGRGTVPRDDHAVLLHHKTSCAADNPAMVRQACAADLLGAPDFAHGVDQLDPLPADDGRRFTAASPSPCRSNGRFCVGRRQKRAGPPAGDGVALGVPPYIRKRAATDLDKLRQRDAQNRVAQFVRLCSWLKLAYVYMRLPQCGLSTCTRLARKR